MALRYYKKYSPETTVPVPPNGAVRFTTLNGLLGYFATDNPDLHAVFEKCMAEGRSGISEISAEEFTQDYLEPKKAGTPTNLNRPWRREEFGAMSSNSEYSPLTVLGAEAVSRVVGVVSPPKPLVPPACGPTKCSGMALETTAPASAPAAPVAPSQPVTPAAGAAAAPPPPYVPKTGKRAPQKGAKLK